MDVQYNAAKHIFLSKSNIQEAINLTLNDAVPSAFRHATGETWG